MLYPYRELTITSKVQEYSGREFVAKLGEFDYSYASNFSWGMPQCILCDSGFTENLIKASTADIDVTFRTFATKTNYYQLLARLATASDMHAMDVYHHKYCNTKLYTLARSAD